VVRRDRRARRPTALILLDLDYFKSVNDTWGHPAGDRVLRIFCETIASVLRPHDVLGRVGGEEFAVVLPDTEEEAAAAVAERIRVATAGIAVEASGEPIAVTTSIGVSADRRASIEELFAAADTALYRAKENGRDRIEFAPAAAAREGYSRAA
jgi:diguanylate cyclase (GGDEF)-like protein